MATIYDCENGNEITAGLQGSNVCDEAILCAESLADDLGRPVMLHDDDGRWIVYPADPYGVRHPADIAEV
jgi:hypothetical protein